MRKSTKCFVFFGGRYSYKRECVDIMTVTRRKLSYQRRYVQCWIWLNANVNSLTVERFSVWTYNVNPSVDSHDWWPCMLHVLAYQNKIKIYFFTFSFRCYFFRTEIEGQSKTSKKSQQKCRGIPRQLIMRICFQICLQRFWLVRCKKHNRRAVYRALSCNALCRAAWVSDALERSVFIIQSGYHLCSRYHSHNCELANWPFTGLVIHKVEVNVKVQIERSFNINLRVATGVTVWSHCCREPVYMSDCAQIWNVYFSSI